jgi:hypothetical protein
MRVMHHACFKPCKVCSLCFLCLVFLRAVNPPVHAPNKCREVSPPPSCFRHKCDNIRLRACFFCPCRRSPRSGCCPTSASSQRCVPTLQAALSPTSATLGPSARTQQQAPRTPSAVVSLPSSRATTAASKASAASGRWAWTSGVDVTWLPHRHNMLHGDCWCSSRGSFLWVCCAYTLC